MGHDISGYLRSTQGASDEIAYLRRGAGNPLNIAIYDALQCHEQRGEFSGCGGAREFTEDQLTAALSRVPAGDEYEPERRFLRDCIAANGLVRIEFY
jgi:hypothetical protein